MRLTRLLLVTSGLFLLAILAWYSLEVTRSQELSRSARAEREIAIQSIMSLEGRALERHVSDYTFWDDLVAFVNSPSPNWGSENIDTVAKGYDASESIVVSKANKVVYHYQDPNAPTTLSDGEVIAAVQDSFVNQRPFAHRYLWKDGVLVELRMGRIYPSGDFARKGQWFGYYICARTWDAALTNKLQNLTKCRIALTRANPVAPAATSDDLQSSFVHLSNGNDKPIATVVFKSVSDTYSSAAEQAKLAAFLLVALTICIIVLVRSFISKWAVRPLELVAKSIARSDVNLLTPLLQDPTEAGQLAKVAREFFIQRAELQMRGEEFESLNEQLLEMNEDLERRVAQRTVELEKAVEGTILGWSKALEARDHETEGHTQRVAKMSLALAKAAKLSEVESRNIYYGALLHDIGKIGIPDSILLKAGKLSDAEYDIMKTHPLIALEMLSSIGFLADALLIPLYHHEKWDGTGYPTGAQGEDIPYAARLFAIADVWDALRSHRPYRTPWSEAKTREYILSESGKHFDPSLVNVFLAMEPMAHPSDSLFDESDGPAFEQAA